VVQKRLGATMPDTETVPCYIYSYIEMKLCVVTLVSVVFIKILSHGKFYRRFQDVVKC
jgi:hypothetical protein